MSTEVLTLDDGAQVFVESSHDIGLVSLVVALRTGTRCDAPEKSGLGRVAARMLRRGAGAMSAQDVDNALDRMGAEFTVDAGASSISFHLQVISRNLGVLVDLLHTMFTAPTFADHELDRLLRESAAEVVEARDSDRTVAQKAFQRTFFAGHPYGRHAGGTTETLARITKADVQAWYKQHMASANLVIAYAGDVTRERAVELSKVLTAGLPRTAPMSPAWPAVTVPKGRRLLFVDKPARTQTQIILGRMGTSPHDEDHFALTVGNAIFGGTFTSRIVKAIRTDRGWSYSPGSRLNVEHERHGFYIISAPGVDDAAACLALEIEMLGELIAKGVTEAEAEFVKKYLVRSFAFDIDTAAKRVHHAIDVELLGFPKHYYSSYTKHIAAITAGDVTRAIQNRLNADDFLVVVVGTASTLLEPISKAIPNLASSEVVPYDAE